MNNDAKFILPDGREITIALRGDSNGKEMALYILLGMDGFGDLIKIVDIPNE